MSLRMDGRSRREAVEEVLVVDVRAGGARAVAGVSAV
jgi:hypothetical protein